MIYENIVGESLDFKKLNNYTNMLNLFYSAVLSSMQYHKMELDLKFGEFIDWIDTKGMAAIEEFFAWYTENLLLQQELGDNATEKNNKKSDKKSDKKGKSLKNVK
jgi:hypothetical protein